ncbi:hypothetical protein [Aeromonas salmonicida]|uniref:hyaluronate lyase N-terminal domain-containing protein n=1 Tax=Aeromonas salmonicida TaxID=645 RepID=UPI00232BA51F|nr:hypothetical protein [Aeromonas salmonicida]WCH25176.1 hypothetical protein ONZ54_23200 [Aeromonas salmonicida]
MTEIVLLPPSGPDLAALPLLADMQYLEPFGTDALNRKFHGIVPPGIYRGYQYSLPGAMKIAIGATKNGVAVVEVGNWSINVHQVAPVELTVPKGFAGYLVLDATYGIGVVTKQVDANSLIDAAILKLVPTAELLPRHVILYTLNVPLAATAMLDSYISSVDRMDISLAGLSKVDGGLYVNSPTGSMVVQVRRGLEAQLKTFPGQEGEPSWTTDTRRVSFGIEGVPGGLMLPASLVVEAAGVTATPQGAYQFTKAGNLTLPATAKDGEHVRVSVTAAAVAAALACKVVVAGGAAIATRGGDALAISMDVTQEFLFIKTATGWRC